MSSFQRQRDFVNEQETPAGETLTEFKEIIKIEEEMEDQTEINVKLEEEMDEQRELLDFTQIPKIILHRIERGQQSQRVLSGANFVRYKHIMLVRVKFGGTQKYVKVAATEDGYDFSTFLHKVIEKLNLPLETELLLTDESGTEVDEDVFEELLEAGNLTVTVTAKKPRAVRRHNLPSTLLRSNVSDKSSTSISSDSSDATVTVHINGETEAQTDWEAAKEMVRNALLAKPAGLVILEEYDKLGTLSDGTRRRLVNLLVAKMVENYGTIPPVSVRTEYALGIVSLFPSLRDPYSENGYEHFYDQQSGSGYLAWRIKTVQRSCATQLQRSSTSTTYQDSPKRKREVLCTAEQLLGEECQEAITFLRYSADELAVKEKMRATFQYRQTLLQDQTHSSAVLDVFPQFLNIPGLIDQDFTMMFGEEVAGRFLEKWPTFFKPRILTECRKLISNTHIEDLLFAQHDRSWDSDLSSILLLVHLLPPTYKGHKKCAKISACQAVDHLVRFLQMGASIETFLAGVGPGQPFLLCMGEKKSSIQRRYIVIDHKAIPCHGQTSLAAFDELFKSHFIFSVNYHESLYNFYTFIQTTVFNIDVGKAKESPRVRELRARFFHT